MKKAIGLLVIGVVVFNFWPDNNASKPESGITVAENLQSCRFSLEEIKDLMIGESIQRYPGPCPCPYFSDSAGRRCGNRSAWSKPGGYSPLCYVSDISVRDAESFCSAIRFRQ